MFSVASDISRRVSVRSLAASFSPASIADLVVWYDADNEGSVQIGSGVAAWNSRTTGSTANAATQITGNNQPAYQKAQQGGRNALYFDGTNDSLVIGNISALFPSAASVVAAFRPDSDTDYALIRTANNSAFWQYPTNRTYIGTFKGTRLNNVATTLPTSGNSVVTITSDASNYRVYTGATLIHDVAADFSAGTSHALGVNDLGSFYKGWIYEILYFSRTLTAAEQAAINWYLSAKWKY